MKKDSIEPQAVSEDHDRGSWPATGVSGDALSDGGNRILSWRIVTYCNYTLTDLRQNYCTLTVLARGTTEDANTRRHSAIRTPATALLANERKFATLTSLSFPRLCSEWGCNSLTNILLYYLMSRKAVIHLCAFIHRAKITLPYSFKFVIENLNIFLCTCPVFIQKF